MPEAKLTQKPTKYDKKQANHKQKRKIVKYINEQLATNATMSTLAEAKSLSGYNRKRLALSFEKPNVPFKKSKSHYPSQQAWDVNAAMEELENFPKCEIMNWSAMARKYGISNGNGAQVLKEAAEKQGIEVNKLDGRDNSLPRLRTKKRRLPGGEISMPSLPPPEIIVHEKQNLIETGELSIGEPCSPFTITKTVVTSECSIETTSVQISGRKIPLTDLRRRLIKKHEQFMQLSTDDDIQEMSKDQILDFMKSCHQRIQSDMSIDQLQANLAVLQRTRTLAIWHDHSTILKTSYILFAIHVIYDPAVFLTEDEYKSKRGQPITNLQAVIEEPAIYMIAPSSSSPTDQLALVSDRIECLQEISVPTTTSNGINIHDQLRFFGGDKPAQQFERGTQIGGTYKCSGCGCKDSMMSDLAHALQNKWRSLAELQSVILAGKHGNAPGQLKPLEGLKVQELRNELTARGEDTEDKLKTDLQDNF